MSPLEDKTKEPSVPHRRWRRRIFYPFILIVGLLTWVNGPGFRWGFEKIISQQLETQDLSGNFILEGSALSGISVRDISLNGTSIIQHVESDLIKVEWSIGSLIDLELESIALNRIHIVIDPEAPKTEIFSSDRTQGPASGPKTSLTEILGLIKKFIQPTKISISDLKVEIDDITQVSLGSLTHTAGENYYLISDLQSRDHLDRNIYNPESLLTWNREGIFIDQITFNPQLSVRNISFKPEKSASMTISVAGSEIFAESDLESSYRISLKSPSLSIPSLLNLAKPELESSGEITKLKIDTATGLLALEAVSYTHLRAHETVLDLVCRLLLEKKGNDYWARCPFHSEKTSSFSVSENKQFYHCFGCGAHGTAVSFMMEYIGMDFISAINDLASRVGMQVPASEKKEYEGSSGFRVSGENKESSSQNMFETMSTITKFYKEQLKPVSYTHLTLPTNREV